MVVVLEKVSFAISEGKKKKKKEKQLPVTRQMSTVLYWCILLKRTIKNISDFYKSVAMSQIRIGWKLRVHKMAQANSLKQAPKNKQFF